MKSDLDYWIALDKRREHFIRRMILVPCSKCGKKYLTKRNPRIKIFECGECYRKRLCEAGKRSVREILRKRKEKAQRGGNDER